MGIRVVEQDEASVNERLAQSIGPGEMGFDDDGDFWIGFDAGAICFCGDEILHYARNEDEDSDEDGKIDFNGTLLFTPLKPGETVTLKAT